MRKPPYGSIPMNRGPLALVAATLFLSGCAHPEDRRWADAIPGPQTALADWQPTINVYTVPTPVPASKKTKLRDLSDRGQAALITAMSGKDTDPDKLKERLSGSLEGSTESDTIDATAFDRTLVISINRPVEAPVGDRLMRTIVTIRPEPGFVFTGYTIAKTEYSTQDIAHIENADEISLGASLAPTIKGFGDNSITGSYGRKTTSSADITAAYEKLGIDIQPDRLIVIRDSERGTDVQGNTLVELTMARRTAEEDGWGFMATTFLGFKTGAPLGLSQATFGIKRVNFLASCPVRARVDFSYLMRKVVSGREYYTEGKQRVMLQPGSLYNDNVVLLNASETQPMLYQIVATQGYKESVLLAQTIEGQSGPLLFDDAVKASAFARWIRGKTGKSLGKDGVIVTTGSPALDQSASYAATRYTLNCTDR